MFSGDGWPLWFVWLLYIVTGSALLTLLWWPVRRAPQWVKVPLFSILAGLIFTPVPIEPNSVYWAPATLVLIFEMEKYGTAMLMRTLGPILVTTVGFLFLALALVWRTAGKKQPTKSERDSV